jgi:hypothetical protein
MTKYLNNLKGNLPAREAQYSKSMTHAYTCRVSDIILLLMDVTVASTSIVIGIRYTLLNKNETTQRKYNINIVQNFVQTVIRWKPYIKNEFL